VAALAAIATARTSPASLAASPRRRALAAAAARSSRAHAPSQNLVHDKAGHPAAEIYELPFDVG
jgi:hypothetical protein